MAKKDDGVTERVNWNSRMVSGAGAGVAPWSDYEDLSIHDLLGRIDTLTDENKALVLAYELSRDKPRTVVLKALGRKVEEESNSEVSEEDNRSEDDKMFGVKGRTYDWVTPTAEQTDRDNQA